ncbi:MAG: hypothetical protein LBN22_02340 [Clostridiales Family XIII bacterium]|nr:hypothetical protein [Clostridiales Family XIII bacterium]
MRYNSDKSYYAVTVKCGHVGRNHYMPITFAISAEDGAAAAQLARGFKRVKHDHKDVILCVNKIDIDEFITIKTNNNHDPYLHCKNIQDQRKYNQEIEKRKVPEKLVAGKKHKIVDSRNQQHYVGKNVIKTNLKRFTKYYTDLQGYSCAERCVNQT